MKAPTSEQLRDRIDQGLTGDKVAVPDPAAAPLGTDAEAGGTPPTPKERAIDAASAPDERAPDRRRPMGPAIYLALAICLGAALVAIIVFAS